MEQTFSRAELQAMRIPELQVRMLMAVSYFCRGGVQPVHVFCLPDADGVAVTGLDSVRQQGRACREDFDCTGRAAAMTPPMHEFELV